MTQKSVFINSLLILLITFCLYGCGGNVFKGLGLVPTSTGNQEAEINNLLDNASTPADYQNAITKLDAIISTSTDASVISKAKFSKGEAILGKNQISLTDIASSFVNVSSENGILDALKSKTTGNIIEAADLLNAGKDTSDKNKEITRGLVNTMTVINSVQTFFIIKNNGQGIEKKSDTNLKTALNSIVASDNVGTYASESISAFSNSGALTNDQKTQTNKISTISSDLTNLNNAVNKSGTPFTYTDDSGQTATINAQSNNTDIEAAMNAIFKK